MAAQKRVHIPRALAVFIVSEVLEALDYAHNARDMDGKPMQIVHRDISPSNIFISKRGDVKLGDFGIAHAQRRESKTQAGTLKGKYGYMSPEQVVGRPIDARSDLFAVGVVLAEMLTGRRLFTAPGRSGRAAQGARRAARSARQVRRRSAPGARPHRAQGAARRTRASAIRRAAEFRDELADYLFADRAAGRAVRSARVHRHAVRHQPRRRRAPAAGRAPHGDAARGAPRPAAGGGRRRATGAPRRRRRRAGRGADRQRPRRGRRGRRRWSATCVSDAPTAPRPRRRTAARGAGPRRTSGEHSSAAGSRPSRRPGEAARRGAGRCARASARRPATQSDVGRFVSGAPKRPPDSAGDVSVITPMRLFCDLALAGETGLLRFELARRAEGDLPRRRRARVGQLQQPRASASASTWSGKRVLGRGDLDLALSMLPHYNGKLGDTLVALGLLRPLDVFRLLSQQVRDRVIDVFAWTEGTFAFYRGVTNRQENFPLGLDTFEILGAGVVSLPPSCSSGGSRRCSTTGPSRPAAAASSPRRSASAPRRARC